MLRKLVLIAFVYIIPFFTFAQKVKDVYVAGDFTFHYPSNISPDEAVRKAVLDAQNQLIEDKFGRLIQQYNNTTIINSESESFTHFRTNAESSLNGMWVETIGSPQVDWTGGEGLIIVNISIKGKIREITNNVAEFEAHVLRNGTNIKYESVDFLDDDSLYLHFKANADGFLAIYLDDHNGNVAFLSPYNNTNDIITINKSHEYVFFKSESTLYYTDNNKVYYMECSSNIVEHNTIHLVFSPNYFSLAEASEIDNIMVTDTMTFHSWLTRILSRDKQMTRKEIDITIRPKTR